MLPRCCCLCPRARRTAAAPAPQAQVPAPRTLQGGPRVPAMRRQGAAGGQEEREHYSAQTCHGSDWRRRPKRSPREVEACGEGVRGFARSCLSCASSGGSMRSPPLSFCLFPLLLSPSHAQRVCRRTGKRLSSTGSFPRSPYTGESGWSGERNGCKVPWLSSARAHACGRHATGWAPRQRGGEKK
jgi:hypothetical protein